MQMRKCLQESPREVGYAGREFVLLRLSFGESSRRSRVRGFLRSICVFLPSLTHFVRHCHLPGKACNGAPRACKFHHGGRGSLKLYNFARSAPHLFTFPFPLFSIHLSSPRHFPSALAISSAFSQQTRKTYRPFEKTTASDFFFARLFIIESISGLWETSQSSIISISPP